MLPSTLGSRISGTDHRPSVCATHAIQSVLDSWFFGIDISLCARSLFSHSQRGVQSGSLLRKMTTRDLVAEADRCSRMAGPLVELLLSCGILRGRTAP